MITSGLATRRAAGCGTSKPKEATRPPTPVTLRSPPYGPDSTTASLHPARQYGTPFAEKRHNNQMPPSRRDARQTAPPPEQSVLRVPQAEAETKLTERIAVGRVLVSRPPTHTTDVDALRHEIEQWRDFNRTWLDMYLGGEAAEEYRSASTHWGSAMAPSNPTLQLRLLRQETENEISKLQSIHERLQMWAPEPDMNPDSQEDTSDRQSSASDSTIATNRKAVMVIYGHDHEANEALFSWLRAIGLQPREWSQLVHASGDASPYIGQILEQAFKDAQAVIAFFTPDEFVLARGSAPTDRNAWRLQARPNVLVEAGMALVTHPRRTVLVVLGPQELPSDLAGRHYIRLSHESPATLHALASRLHDAGCEIDQTGTDWLNVARFPDRDSIPQHPVALF